MAEEVIRFGLVGAGGIAQAYAQAFKDLKIARLVGVADVNLAAARKLGEQIGCRSYDSYEALGDEWPLDAVIICTPPVSHPEIALHFCQRKVHVLCEKPLSIDVSSAELMLDTARRNGVKLTMASKFRYVEDVVRAKSIVRSGILGDILLVENAFTSRIDMSERWKLPALKSDLAMLGVPAEVWVVGNGSPDIQTVAAAFGCLYVLEGSTLGGQMITREVSERLGMEPQTGCQFFPQTGHNICGAILSTWRASGLEFDGKRGKRPDESLALFGLPISEPQQETTEGGQTLLVQWFERARFEYHPENHAPYDVLLGRLGSALDAGAR